MAMTYGHVYVARVAFGAKDMQTVQGLPGGRGLPRAVAHHRLQPLHRPRLRPGARAEQQKLAVDSRRLAALPLRPAAHRRRASRRCSSTRGAAEGRRRATTCATRPASAWSRTRIPSASSGCSPRPSARPPAARLYSTSTSSSPRIHGRRSRDATPAARAAGRDGRSERHGPLDHLPRLRPAAPAHARRLAAGRRPRHGAAPRGRRRRRDRHALALRGADRARADGDVARSSRRTSESYAEALSLPSRAATRSRSGPTSTWSRSGASRRPSRCR